MSCENTNNFTCDNSANCPVYCSLPKFKWYWGHMTRSEAEALLLSNPGTFIIRDSGDPRHLLCITFKSRQKISHVRLQHYKGMFSFDKKTYVPIERIPEHCISVGKENMLFYAEPLERQKGYKLVLDKR